MSLLAWFSREQRPSALYLATAEISPRDLKPILLSKNDTAISWETSFVHLGNCISEAPAVTMVDHRIAAARKRLFQLRPVLSAAGLSNTTRAGLISKAILSCLYYGLCLVAVQKAQQHKLNLL